MAKPLRVLIVEDSENDAMLLLRELQKGGYQIAHERVWTADALDKALDRDWDVVLSDYVMPAFSGLAALELAQRKQPDIPFIVVSGQIGEDVAVTAMRAGAHDYIMKGNLKRLIPAVERELSEVVVRRERRVVEDALKQTSEQLKLVTDTIEDVFWMSTPGAKQIIYVSPAYEKIWGRPRDQIYNTPDALLEGVHPADRAHFLDSLKKHAQGLGYEQDFRVIRPDGTMRWLHSRAFPVYDRDGKVVCMTGIQSDVTRLQMVNRALLTLTRCNEALVRCSGEDDLLRTVCQAIVESGGYRMCWVGYAEGGRLKQIKPICSAGHNDGYLEAIQITWSEGKHGRGPSGMSLKTGKPAVVRDILSDPSFRPWRDEAVKRGYGSSISLPLMENGQAFGILGIYASERNAFDEEEVRLLAQLADDLSFGIRAIRTRVQRDQAEAELRALANRLVQSQEEERRSIARELHDQTGQQLTFLKLLLERIRRATEKQTPPPEIEEAQNVVTEVIGQVRGLSLSLRPGMLDDLGLLPAMQWYLQDFTAKTRIEVAFHHSGLNREFSQQVGTAAFRIVQEALTNVVRYAKVGEVSVTVRADHSHLSLQIHDSGIGFDPASVPLTSSGIRGARERALSLGGKFSVQSAPGKGTTIAVSLPLAQPPTT